MAYDNTCKYLAETYAANFVRWIWGINPTNIRVLKTEIIPEPIVSDSLTFCWRFSLAPVLRTPCGEKRRWKLTMQFSR